MDNIKGIVNKVIGDIADKSPNTDEKLHRIWQNLMSKQELKHTKIDGTKDGVLFVCVDSPAWLFQMRIKQSKILRQLKEEVQGIDQIRLKVGKVK